MRDNVCSIALRGGVLRDCTTTGIAKSNVIAKISAALSTSRRGGAIVYTMMIEEMVASYFATPCRWSEIIIAILIRVGERDIFIIDYVSARWIREVALSIDNSKGDKTN